MEGLDDEPGAIAILDIGGVDLDTDEQTGSIGHDMALATLDLLWPHPPGRGFGAPEDGLRRAALILPASDFGPHVVPR